MAAASAALLDKRIAEAEAWETREKAKYTLVICVLCVALDALEVIGLFLAPACECTCGDPSSGGGAGVVERATANGKHMNRMWPQMTVLFVIASGGFTAIFCGVVCMVSVCTFPPSWQGAKDVAVEFFKDKYIPFKLFLTVVGVGVLSYTINECARPRFAFAYCGLYACCIRGWGAPQVLFRVPDNLPAVRRDRGVREPEP